MRARCKGKYPGHHRYTSKAITCDPEWFNSYDTFLADMGECPDGLTLDRIDNAKGYSKDNCRWADYDTQLYNRSCTLRFDWQGESLTLRELSELSGISMENLYGRIVRWGWPVGRAMTTPVRKRKTATQ